LEDRLAAISTIALAIFFLIKMFIGSGDKGGYIDQIYDKDPTIVGN
jgi:hypothetical protein